MSHYIRAQTTEAAAVMRLIECVKYVYENAANFHVLLYRHVIPNMPLDLFSINTSVKKKILKRKLT